jgi:hypothetical protein
MKLARLGIQASNLCTLGSYLHSEIAGRHLGLKLLLRYFGTLLLKERHMLLGIC